MDAQTICRAPATTHLLPLLAVFTLAGGVSWAQAQGITPGQLERRIVEVHAAVAPALAPRPLTPVMQRALVWRGVDVDGDGQDDFTNPTGRAVRVHDGYGCGEFGASRDGGERDHEGVDYIARAGQGVKAPISGYVTRIGQAYDGDGRYHYVEITNPAIRYVTRVFYVDPKVREGQAVRLGQDIGRAHSLQARYPGITNHVHLEISRLGGRKLDATRLINARYEVRPVQNLGTGPRMAVK